MKLPVRRIQYDQEWDPFPKNSFFLHHFITSKISMWIFFVHKRDHHFVAHSGNFFNRLPMPSVCKIKYKYIFNNHYLINHYIVSSRLRRLSVCSIISLLALKKRCNLMRLISNTLLFPWNFLKSVLSIIFLNIFSLLIALLNMINFLKFILIFSLFTRIKS